jgi:hypothetical protein
MIPTTFALTLQPSYQSLIIQCLKHHHKPMVVVTLNKEILEGEKTTLANVTHELLRLDLAALATTTSTTGLGVHYFWGRFSHFLLHSTILTLSTWGFHILQHARSELT